MSEQNNNIKFDGADIPIQLAWKKLELLNSGADLLSHLNSQYPHLASDFTTEILTVVRERIQTVVGDAKPPEKLEDDYVAYLKKKIQTYSAEECLELLHSSYNVEISLYDLVYFVGEAAYSTAMMREAVMYKSHKILPDQTATLWNEAGLPAPGKQRWNSRDVESLLTRAEKTAR